VLKKLAVFGLSIFTETQRIGIIVFLFLNGV